MAKPIVKNGANIVWAVIREFLESQVNYIIGKDQTQQLELCNGIMREQTGC